jgi:hypothetical protein
MPLSASGHSTNASARRRSRRIASCAAKASAAWSGAKTEDSSSRPAATASSKYSRDDCRFFPRPFRAQPPFHRHHRLELLYKIPPTLQATFRILCVWTTRTLISCLLVCSFLLLSFSNHHQALPHRPILSLPFSVLSYLERMLLGPSKRMGERVPMLFRA